MASFDNKNGTFTLCGNRWAGAADFAREAEQDCEAVPPVMLGCQREQIGTVATAKPSGFGGAIAYARPVYGMCCAYRCPQIREGIR